MTNEFVKCRLLIGAGLAVVLILALACSSDGDESAPATPAPAAPVASATAAPPAPASSVADQRDVAMQELTEDDEAAIHSAVIRQIYTVDHGYSSRPDFPTVYLAGIIVESIRTKVVATLGDLTPQFEWVNHWSESPLDDRGDVVGIVITVSTISQQPDGSVHVWWRLLCGSLCGSGQTYIIKQVDERWKVIGDTGPRLIS